jgi:hypothetical protein
VLVLEERMTKARTTSPLTRNQKKKMSEVPSVATQDRIFPHYVLNSSIKHNKSDSKDRSQEIL